MLDPTFGEGDRVLTDFAHSDDTGDTLAIQQDGKILAAGMSNQGAAGLDFGVARYNADGSLDSSFGTGGRVTIDFDSPDDRATAITIQPDGKIVVVGLSYQGTSGYTFGVSRLTSQGNRILNRCGEDT